MAVNSLTFKGVEGDERIHLSAFNGSSWTQPQALRGANSSTGPALVVFNGELNMTWKGAAGDQKLFFASFDGTNWTEPRAIPNANSSADPALTRR
jgi:hypothetical protein